MALGGENPPLVKLHPKIQSIGVLEKEDIMENKYCAYRLYECPKKPTECGKYVGMVQVREQAKKACEIAKQRRKNYFIKGVKTDGSEIILL